MEQSLCGNNSLAAAYKRNGCCVGRVYGIYRYDQGRFWALRKSIQSIQERLRGEQEPRLVRSRCLINIHNFQRLMKEKETSARRFERDERELEKRQLRFRRLGVNDSESFQKCILADQLYFLLNSVCLRCIQ